MAIGTDAMRAGDGEKLLAVLKAAKNPAHVLKAIGGAADDDRWDVRCGRAVLHAADYILAQPIEHIARFLPCMAIAAAREHNYDAAAKRDAAAAILAKLPAVLKLDEGAADLVARSGCHAWKHKLRKESRDLYELVKGNKLVAKNPYYIELRKHHAK